jgi:hypothetical protein
MGVCEDEGLGEAATRLVGRYESGLRMIAWDMAVDDSTGLKICAWA